jgi:hypothetical protein
MNTEQIIQIAQAFNIAKGFKSTDEHLKSVAEDPEKPSPKSLEVARQILNVISVLSCFMKINVYLLTHTENGVLIRWKHTDDNQMDLDITRDGKVSLWSINCGVYSLVSDGLEDTIRFAQAEQ